jgi:hypothetical protein
MLHLFAHKETGYRTRSVLVVPIKDDDGNVIGAIQVMNKKSKDGSPAIFTENDEKLMTMMVSSSEKEREGVYLHFYDPCALLLNLDFVSLHITRPPM